METYFVLKRHMRDSRNLAFFHDDKCLAMFSTRLMQRVLEILELPTVMSTIVWADDKETHNRLLIVDRSFITRDNEMRTNFELSMITSPAGRPDYSIPVDVCRMHDGITPYIKEIRIEQAIAQLMLKEIQTLLLSEPKEDDEDMYESLLDGDEVSDIEFSPEFLRQEIADGYRTEDYMLRLSIEDVLEIHDKEVGVFMPDHEDQDQTPFYY
ncbi:hypothetical protein HOS33_gp312 [Erwinia phage vB_EamM_Y3]|uniref:Uncharacterized protein n=1 Tax=Erwinia phage vB_EamM_Y3 TaxID=1983553 RepID=A0A2H4IBN6_9CAUD|nr:hypothetical protein HOS33_gp312 [Erwinia phage vB_EamM_Y3]ARW58952.1 hypothetical protein Y3_312 [Erwinia phage vB_EamM_Y3]